MDFSDSPTTIRQIPWKMIVMITGGLVIAVLVIVLVVRSTDKKQNLSQEASSSQTFSTARETESPPSTISCERAQDPSLCEQYAMKQRAVLSQDISVCEKLQGGQKEDCLWGVANAKQDEKICERLKEEVSQTACADAILFDQAIRSSKIALCDKITRSLTKEGCEQYILGPITPDTCAARGKDAAYCEMLSVSEQAIKAQDRSMCDVLKEDQEKLCQERVVFDDPDFDGLDSGSEKNVYKTDPRKTDTDGDGYSDKQEIDTGHDPLKK
jgi:hypothetical protein